MASDPLVFAEDLRVDIDGIPACDGITLQTSGERVIICGTPHAFFEALTGLRPVVRGALRVRGIQARSAALEGRVAGAPLEPPLPPKWTALEYVTWSARLAGHSPAAAKEHADEALRRVQLHALSKQPLARAVPHARRAVVLAAAMATGADVLVVEDPLANLPEESARIFASIFVDALEDKSWVVLTSQLGLTSPLTLAADEALLLSGARLDVQGPPAEIFAEHRFVARIHGNLEPFLEKVAARGVRGAVEGAHVVLDLGSSVTTADVLAIAVETDVVVVELVPLARA